jgi:hypothetical protein
MGVVAYGQTIKYRLANVWTRRHSGNNVKQVGVGFVVGGTGIPRISPSARRSILDSFVSEQASGVSSWSTLGFYSRGGRTGTRLRWGSSGLPVIVTQLLLVNTSGRLRPWRRTRVQQLLGHVALAGTWTAVGVWTGDVRRRMYKRPEIGGFQTTATVTGRPRILDGVGTREQGWNQCIIAVRLGKFACGHGMEAKYADIGEQRHG